MRSLSSLAITILLAASSLQAACWSFAVAGDDRTDIRAEKVDPTGIHTEVLSRLLRTIAERKPSFLLFTGDLVYGENMRIPAKISEQFQTWKRIISAEAPGLPVLPVRGTHELPGDSDGQSWIAEFAAGLETLKVEWLPQERGFSYLWIPEQHTDCAFIALDQFMHGREHRVNLAGLEHALKEAKTRGAKHLFVFAHEMAFTCGSHPDEENMSAHVPERNAFLDLLARYGAEWFFAGHDHLYDRMLVTSPKWPREYALQQIVAGTAGAPFYPDKGYRGDHEGYQLKRLDHRQDTYGYLWVTVNDAPKPGGKPVTVEFVPLLP